MSDLYTYESHDFKSYAIAHEETIKNLFHQFQNDFQQGKHPILEVVNPDDTLDIISQHIQSLPKDIKTIVILGTGGSSLGARAIASWMGYHHNLLLNRLDVNILAHDNLDDLSYQIFLDKVDFQSTHFLVISKSGGTLETNVQFQILLDRFKERNLSETINKNITIVTELHQNKNYLHHLADAYDIVALPHSKVIGGRYSVLTMTGLLPASMLGIDCKKLLSGARQVVELFKNSQDVRDVPACLGAVDIVLAEKFYGKTTHIFAGYGDRFSEFATWVRQLWAESLGKNGLGGLFVPSIGPLDQHSQLQLYYGGPDNKTYSFVECRNRDTKQLSLNFDAESSFSYLNHKTMQDVVNASCAGTIESLRSVKRPVRRFIIDDYSVEVLGAMMMHFIIETVFSSYIHHVNPYDQPAVEDSKKRTQAILRGTR